MTARDKLRPRLFLDRDMDEPERLRFAGGTACLFSGRSPAGEGPNEDAAAVIPTAGGGILVVCDGLGGMAAGETASRLTIEALAASVRDASPPALREAILCGVEAANAAVMGLGVAAGTTLVVAEILGRRIRSYHVGDSALLLAGEQGEVRHLTVPHSPVGYGVEAGLLDAREAMFHEDRHLISNMVGVDHMHIDLGPAIAAVPGDTVLLATDGLFDNLHVQEVTRALRRAPLEAAVGELARACRRRMVDPSSEDPSKPDDHTLVAWRPDPPRQHGGGTR